MNKRKVATVAVKTARRYPKPTLRATKFAVRHRRGLLKTARGARMAKRGTADVIARVSDQGFRRELHAGASALQAAANRSQKLGSRKAMQDKQVGKLLKEAAAHTSTALHLEPKRKKHTLRTIAVGAGAAAVAALAIRQWVVSGNGAS